MSSSPTVGAPSAWQGWPEVRADLRAAVRLVVVLALTGVPAGLVWWLLAPRADYRITEDGPVVLGQPSEELLVADDSVFVLVLGLTGLLGGALAWRWRRRRGVATVLALAVGGGLCAVVAWRVGELLGAGPSADELAEVGAVVTTSLSLISLPALAVAPFAAVLAYLVGVLSVAEDGLDRTADRAPGPAVAAAPAPEPLADAGPAHGPPSRWPPG